VDVYISVYTSHMVHFEWDRNKNHSNFEKHGLLFEDVIEAFGGICLTRVDDRRDYGEVRELTLGEVQGRVVCIVYTRRHDRIRIISARKASSEEREAYYEFIKGSEA